MKKMQTAILVHGVGTSSSDADYKLRDVSRSMSSWRPFVQLEYLRAGVLAQSLEFPHAFIPAVSYREWANVIDNFKIDENTSLIGHSAGGGFLLQYLSDNFSIRARHLVCVAPWLNLDKAAPAFVSGDLDPRLAQRVGRIDVFYSDDDESHIIDSIKYIHAVLGDKINFHKTTGKGHISGVEHGPDIWEICKTTI